jgi:hypothetical protein
MFCFKSQQPVRDRARPQHRRKHRLGFEALEARLALSLGPELPSPVNTTIPNNQVDSDNATAGNGLAVVVWTHSLSTSTTEIRAQRFVNGVPFGKEFQIDSSFPHDSTPAVAINRHGDFVVTWTRTVNGDTNVMARRFDWGANPLGATFPVANSKLPEFDPDVAMGSDGRFVVTYTAVAPNTAGVPMTSKDILAKLYINNNPLTIPVAVAPGNQTRSSVAMVPDGLFDVAYQDDSGNGDIRLVQYGSKGNLIKSIQVATSGAVEEAPSVAVDDGFNAVVAYQEVHNGRYEIVARRVTNMVSPEIVIRQNSDDHKNPSVALSPVAAPIGGKNPFVVAYDTVVNASNHVEVTEVSSMDQLAGPFDAGVRRTTPAVSIDASNHYLLTYTSNDGTDFNIRGRLGHL